MNGDCLHQRCSSLWSASSVSWRELEAPRLPRFLRLLHTESRQQKPRSCKAIHRSWILRVAPNPRYPPCSYGMVAMVTTHLKASGRTEVKLTIKAAFKAMPTISSPLGMTWLTVSIRLNWKTIVYTPQQYHITKHPIMDHLLKGHTHVYLNTRTHTKLKLAQNNMCQIHFHWLEQTKTNTALDSPLPQLANTRHFCTKLLPLHRQSHLHIHTVQTPHSWSPHRRCPVPLAKPCNREGIEKE